MALNGCGAPVERLAAGSLRYLIQSNIATRRLSRVRPARSWQAPERPASAACKADGFHVRDLPGCMARPCGRRGSRLCPILDGSRLPRNLCRTTSRQPDHRWGIQPCPFVTDHALVQRASLSFGVNAHGVVDGHRASMLRIYRNAPRSRAEDAGTPIRDFVELYDDQFARKERLPGRPELKSSRRWHAGQAQGAFGPRPRETMGLVSKTNRGNASYTSARSQNRNNKVAYLRSRASASPACPDVWTFSEEGRPSGCNGVVSERGIQARRFADGRP